MVQFHGFRSEPPPEPTTSSLKVWAARSAASAASAAAVVRRLVALGAEGEAALGEVALKAAEEEETWDEAWGGVEKEGCRVWVGWEAVLVKWGVLRWISRIGGK